jgi:hypothetical protein
MVTTALDYVEIARSVLRIAATCDPRMEPSCQEMHNARRESWATLFAGHVWPAEAEQAVYDHYRDPRAFPLMPGDVVDYCAKQPVWSSTEHATDWILRVGVRNPYSGAIEAYSGIQEPVIDIPESVPRCQHKTYLIEQLTAWASTRLDELTAAIVAKQFKPWWTGP